jgi:Flp pilus assembly pilin Flp
MAMVWMDNKRQNLLLNSKGQTAVEYILLLSVISVLTFSVINSKKFKDFMGPDSSFFAAIRSQVEFTYRHGYANRAENDKTNNNYTSNHETYYNSEESKSRFFTGGDEYPR